MFLRNSQGYKQRATARVKPLVGGAGLSCVSAAGRQPGRLDVKECAMNRYDSDRPASGMLYMLGGFAIGMLTMYLLDPVQGTRRRAVIRDKAYSAALTTRKRADAATRDIANRARGLAAEASRMVKH